MLISLIRCACICAHLPAVACCDVLEAAFASTSTTKPCNRACCISQNVHREFDNKRKQIEDWGKAMNDEVLLQLTDNSLTGGMLQQRSACLLATQRGEFLVKYAASKRLIGMYIHLALSWMNGSCQMRSKLLFICCCSYVALYRLSVLCVQEGLRRLKNGSFAWLVLT